MAASETRQLEAIFIATPPCTPLITSLTRTTTPRDLPTMYHFDFANMESDAAEDNQIDGLGLPPPPLTSGMPIPVPEHASVERTPCPICSRNFILDALRKHIVVCEKAAAKKRKVFDSSRQRREGTSLSTYVLPKNFGLPNAEKAAGVHTPPGVSRESTTLAANSQAVASPLPVRRSTTRIVKQKSSVALGEGPTTAATAAAPTAAATVAPPALSRDRMRSSERSISKRIKDVASNRCPHCERSFNPKAFDRHVEWCKEKAIQATINPRTTDTSKAKERMEARKQYRPPNLKTKRGLNRDKYSEEQYEAEMVAQKQQQMSLSSMTSSVHSDNGISPLASDKYDPFLSAKRQLEELCSPNTPPDNEPPTATPTPTPTRTSSTMSTSLMSTLGKPQTTTKTTPTSNFRRTSSLRGPRRTPLLPSRPLFATNYRPTIQRGLSDEGPISNNFLKPEEYDEIPVRAACGNDFHSPRVVRRDTSASNRKQQLKLPLGGAVPETTETNKQPTRNVAKTDSLAVFLKYEHELEQLNAKAAEVAAISKELNSKELKDKSNNLSKQNSAKNLTINPNSGQLPPLTTPISPPTTKENNENVAHNFSTPLRLEPIISKPMTPLSSLTPNNSHVNGTPIKLESIFGVSRLGDYIDPKLINPCDNLHVQQSSTGSSSNASSTPQQLTQSRSSSQSTITMGQEQRRHSGDSRNLLKRKMRLGRNQFLYDASPEEAYISSGSCADDEANRSSLEYDEQCWQQQQKQLLSNPLSMNLNMPKMPQLPTFDDFDFEEFLSSFENENDEEQFPLFRDCREFLLNRTSSRHRSFQKATSTLTSTPQTQSQTQIQTQTQPQPQNPIQNPIQSPIPTPTSVPTQTQLIMSPNTPQYMTTTKESHTHRSDSNGSFKSPTNSVNSYKTPASSNCSYKTPGTCSDEKMQRQQSNVSGSQKSVDESSQKREIFISIETEPNDQGRSPISPASLRHMVGNPQTHVDVLHIENGNEPEHAKFSKISDTEDHFDAQLDDETNRSHYNKKRLTSSSNPASASLPLPNVEANNAKNMIEKMRGDFQQLGEEAGASMRRDMLQRNEQAHQKQQQQQQQQQLTPSPSGDSDEYSSLDGYVMSSSQSSRRGASSKLSSDSAYGSSNSPYSLSRQRSGEQQLHSNGTPRSQTQLRPHTASGAMSEKQSSAMMDASTQAQSNYGTLKARQRLFAGSFGGGGGGDGPNDCGAEYSSSSSEHSLPAAVAVAQQQQQQQLQQQQQSNSNFNYQQQQQQSQVQAAYNNNNNNNNNNSYEHKNTNNNNNNNSMTPTTSQHSLVSNISNGSSSMSASMKMSKFCHECGAKFIIEHAKFCMDCGVRRVVL